MSTSKLRSTTASALISMALVGLCLTGPGGCYSWKVTPWRGQKLATSSRNKEVRLHMLGGGVEAIRIAAVRPPYIIDDQGRRIDIRKVRKIEVRSQDGGGAASATSIVLGIMAVAGLAALVAVAAVAGSSKKTAPKQSTGSKSCPFLYVREPSGYRFVGEAYPGAVFRAQQRADLMALPPQTGDGGQVQLRLATVLQESDFTDHAELVVVDHPPSVRAVARGLSGPPLLVGEAAAPLAVKDLRGRDASTAVRFADGRVWQTNLDRVLAKGERPAAREGLIATFARPTSGGRAVLEIRAKNTFWLDHVIDRFFALLGPRFAGFVRRADAPAGGRTLRQWRQREGIDLTLELKTRDGWRPLAVVPTTGAFAMRELAVVLPPTLGAQVTVRLHGGLGFWQVDRLALSTQVDVPARLLRLAPATARDEARRDRRSALEAVDGRYHQMPGPGSWLDLRFALPPRNAGQRRTLFFHSVGYYVPHAPPADERAASPGTARAVWWIPGALGRFSLELLRRYAEQVAANVAAANAAAANVTSRGVR